MDTKTRTTKQGLRDLNFYGSRKKAAAAVAEVDAAAAVDSGAVAPEDAAVAPTATAPADAAVAANAAI